MGALTLKTTNCNPLVVKYFAESLGRVCTTMMAMVEIKQYTAAKIFEGLDLELSKRGISWSNCLSFGADNANFMQGTTSGLHVAYLLKQTHEEFVMVGCACHLMNIAAEKAAKSLPVNIEELLVDVHFYLEE